MVTVRTPPANVLLIPSVGLSWNCESCTVTAPPIFNNPIFVELSISEFVIFAVPSLSTIKLTPWFLVRRELERLRIPWTRRPAWGDKDWKCPPKRTRAWERVADPKGPTKICCQSPACGELVEPSLLVSPPTVSSLREVKIIGLEVLPWALRIPSTNKPDETDSNFIITPDSMVRVLPEDTEKVPCTTQMR